MFAHLFMWQPRMLNVCMQSELGIGRGARDPVAFGKEQERSCEKCFQEPNDRM